MAGKSRFLVRLRIIPMNNNRIRTKEVGLWRRKKIKLIRSRKIFMRSIC